VRCIDFEPGNEWFCTGAADRTIKLWDLASGILKLTLTGHIATVRGVLVSKRHNYIFSCGEDRMVKCWDLEQNKVIRHYHGHLSGIYSIALHPVLDVLCTGGRDSTCRVWDMRTKAEIHVLSGHTNLVASVCCQGADPQVITGSADTTIKLWDLGMGKVLSTLTNHKKSIRAMLLHPTEFSFLSAAADKLKKWKFPKGEFITNLSGHNAVINTVALNQENVLASCSDNGSIWMWDWTTGYPFQNLQTQVQPGSLDSEAGIFACGFDLSGSRFITCEADKTIKIWWEDEDATMETHPVDPMWRPNRDRNRF
jgi:pleiotropic regulator 1